MKELLYLYKLPPAFDLVVNTTGKNMWKKVMIKAIHNSDYWIEELRQDAGTKRPYNTPIKPSSILEKSIQSG